MTAYLLPVALLALLAVAFAVSVLWQRSRPLAFALAIVPLVAAGLYAWRSQPTASVESGAPAAATPTASTPAPASAAAQAGAPTGGDAAVADLEAKLQAAPDRWEDWALLGRIRMEQGQFAAARDAFAKAHGLVPDNDAVAVGYAEALLRASPDQRFPPEAVVLLERAVRADPPDERAVFFLGIQRMLEDQPGAAADLWESLLPRVDEAAAATLRPQIAAALAAEARQAEAGKVRP
jgi:cytochrome c-type biogenesis protein CcmH